MSSTFVTVYTEGSLTVNTEGSSLYQNEYSFSVLGKDNDEKYGKSLFENDVTVKPLDLTSTANVNIDHGDVLLKKYDQSTPDYSSLEGHMAVPKSYVDFKIQEISGVTLTDYLNVNTTTPQNVAGSVDFKQDLKVEGTATLNNVNINGSANLQDLNVKGSARLPGSVLYDVPDNSNDIILQFGPKLRFHIDASGDKPGVYLESNKTGMDEWKTIATMQPIEEEDD